jgi:hypothetical protein
MWHTQIRVDNGPGAVRVHDIEESVSISEVQRTLEYAVSAGKFALFFKWRPDPMSTVHRVLINPHRVIDVTEIE